MARFYRCYNPNCTEHPAKMPGYDFTADVPVCPKCKVDARQPRFSHLIVPLVIIHFDPPSQVPGYGVGELACDGKPSAGRMATGDPEVVNCPACRQTDVWKEAQKGKAVDPRFDFNIDVTPEGPRRVEGEAQVAPVGG